MTGWHAAATLVLRVGIGAGLTYHGASKLFDPGAMEGFSGFLEGLGFPAPVFLAYCSKLTEFLGGIALALGVLTRPAALFVAINMGVAAFVAHAGDPLFGAPGEVSKEMALLYLVPTVALLLSGPGAASADRWLMPKLWRRLRGKVDEKLDEEPTGASASESVDT